MDIELATLNYLLDAGLSVGSEVYDETPVEEPDEYVRIEKVGGGFSNRIDSARIAVQSISRNSLGRARQINSEVKSVMLDMAETEDIFSCRLDSDYNFTNTETKQYRYQAVFTITY